MAVMALENLPWIIVKKKTANPFQNEEIQKVLVGLSVSRTENIFEFIVISFKDYYICNTWMYP